MPPPPRSPNKPNRYLIVPACARFCRLCLLLFRELLRKVLYSCSAVALQEVGAMEMARTAIIKLAMKRLVRKGTATRGHIAGRHLISLPAVGAIAAVSCPHTHTSCMSARFAALMSRATSCMRAGGCGIGKGTRRLQGERRGASRRTRR